MIDLRQGRWQDALSDVEEVDCLITDPPYSERTHRGHDEASAGRLAGEEKRIRVDRRNGNSYSVGVSRRKAISFESFDDIDVMHAVEGLAPRVKGWWAIITDHVLAPHWSRELERAGLYIFAPIPCVDSGSRVRLAGDGPSSWAVWLVVARPRSFHRWGTLPGAYVRQGPFERAALVGGKPLWLMRAIIRDYSRHGDLVCDPFAGMATTLLAAAIEGRRAVGAEMDQDTFEKAQKRIARGYTPSFWF